MNTRKLLFATGIAVLATIYLPTEKVFAQFGGRDSDDLLQLVIHYGESNEARFSSHNGVVGPVSLGPNELLPFTVALPGNMAGYPVRAGALDGGQINASTPQGAIPLSGTGTPPSLAVSTNGTFDFSFQAGSTTGLYRILVTVGVEQYQLQLYVVDPNRPGRIQY